MAQTVNWALGFLRKTTTALLKDGPSEGPLKRALLGVGCSASLDATKSHEIAIINEGAGWLSPSAGFGR